MENDGVMPIRMSRTKVAAGPIRPNFWHKWGQKFLEAKFKNLAPLEFQEFSSLTAAKGIMEKY